MSPRRVNRLGVAVATAANVCRCPVPAQESSSPISVALLLSFLHCSLGHRVQDKREALHPTSAVCRRDHHAAPPSMGRPSGADFLRQGGPQMFNAAVTNVLQMGPEGGTRPAKAPTARPFHGGGPCHVIKLPCQLVERKVSEETPELFILAS